MNYDVVVTTGTGSVSSDRPRWCVATFGAAGERWTYYAADVPDKVKYSFLDEQDAILFALVWAGK